MRRQIRTKSCGACPSAELDQAAPTSAPATGLAWADRPVADEGGGSHEGLSAAFKFERDHGEPGSLAGSDPGPEVAASVAVDKYASRTVGDALAGAVEDLLEVDPDLAGWVAGSDGGVVAFQDVGCGAVGWQCPLTARTRSPPAPRQANWSRPSSSTSTFARTASTVRVLQHGTLQQ